MDAEQDLHNNKSAEEEKSASAAAQSDTAERTRRQLLQTAKLNQLHARVDKILAAGGLLAGKQQHFKERPGQLQMAHQVCTTLHSQELLIAEAGTGTGKTFAYLIPALLEGRSVVISTGSKALQDQLVQVDIPNLLRLLNMEGTTFMGLKGFGNYLCHRRWEQAVLSREIKNPAEKDLVESFEQRVVNELNTDPYHSSFGDVNAALPGHLAAKLTISRNQCLGEKCRYYADTCFPFRARSYAAQSQIVVINHALLFASLASHGYEDAGGQITTDTSALSAEQLQQQLESGELKLHFWFLPDFQALICDEAHMLPEFGRNFYAKQFSSQTLKTWAQQLNRELEQMEFAGRLEFEKLSAELQEKLRLALEYLRRFDGRHNFLELLFDNYDDKLRQQRYPLQLNKQFRGYMVDLYRVMVSLYKKLESNKSAAEVLEILQAELLSQMTVLVELMQSGRPAAAQAQTQSSNRVCVSEVGEHGFAFSSMPLDIGPYFEQDLRKLQAAGTGIIMTSATLSVSGDFGKFAADIGAQNLPHQTLIVPGSFDYGRQAYMYVSSSFPPVDDEERNAKLVDGLQQVIEAVPGGIFVLTTSHRSLQELTALLKDRFANKRLVLAQAGGRSNAQIMQEFRKDGRAILIGTSSFWAGVDVPGQALSLVIIDKLPFASPADPFEKARCRRMEEQGGNPFAHITLPEAIIALRQGAGRLIRSESDSGGLIICDPRLVTQKYSSRFLRALPPMHRCSSLREMIAFINRTSAGNIQQ